MPDIAAASCTFRPSPATSSTASRSARGSRLIADSRRSRRSFSIAACSGSTPCPRWFHRRSRGSSRLRRNKARLALRLAIANTKASGLLGIPDVCHAVTSAARLSCAISSPRPRSPMKPTQYRRTRGASSLRAASNVTQRKYRNGRFGHIRDLCLPQTADLAQSLVSAAGNFHPTGRRDVQPQNGVSALKKARWRGSLSKLVSRPGACRKVTWHCAVPGWNRRRS